MFKSRAKKMSKFGSKYSEKKRLCASVPHPEGVSKANAPLSNQC